MAVAWGYVEARDVEEARRRRLPREKVVRVARGGRRVLVGLDYSETVNFCIPLNRGCLAPQGVLLMVR